MFEVRWMQKPRVSAYEVQKKEIEAVNVGQWNYVSLPFRIRQLEIASRSLFANPMHANSMPAVPATQIKPNLFPP